MPLPAPTGCSPGAAITATCRSAAPSWPAWKASATGCKHRSVLLDPRKADPDLGEEMIRKDLGLIRPDEVIVPLED